MAKYTITLDEILKSGYNLGLSPSDYDIFDEAHRVTLNNKLLNHYRWREIGFETLDRFKQALNIAMNEIMPIHNKMYLAELENLDFLTDYGRVVDGNKVVDVDVTQNIDNETTVDSQTSQDSETGVVSKNKQNSNDTTTLNETSLNIGSDTPQNKLLVGDIEENLYASTAEYKKDGGSNNVSRETSVENDSTTIDDTFNSTESDSVSTTENITDSNTIEKTDVIESGYNQSQSDLIVKYRESLIDVDIEVIENKKISDCFMGVY